MPATQPAWAKDLARSHTIGGGGERMLKTGDELPHLRESERIALMFVQMMKKINYVDHKHKRYVVEKENRRKYVYLLDAPLTTQLKNISYYANQSISLKKKQKLATVYVEIMVDMYRRHKESV